jgi:HSP20 family molecular chaperone IbpA
MKSYLDTIKQPVKLPLLQGEEVLKYYTASYDIGSSLASTWRLGNLYLTNKRLLFVQVRKILFDVLLSQIKAIHIEKREWILGKKVKQLHILRDGRKVPYIAVKDPENWKREIEERTQESPSTPSDPPSATHRARPDEVILKEKGSYVSPGQSMWRLGTLLLTHKKIAFLQSTGIVWETPLRSIKGLRIEKRVYGVSKSDAICVEYESSGELSKAWIITFNLEKWRKELYERALPDRERREPLLDIFNEDADLVVYLELSGVKEDELRLSVANNKLVVDTDDMYHKEIPLTSLVNTENFTQRYNNNILEVKFKKADCQPA